MSSKLVSAFPGTGKSYLYNNYDGVILDSDSSTFDKSDFPANYIMHIKDNIDSADMIMISSHKEVRDALVDNGLEFSLIYPDKSLKDEYIDRYIKRGNAESFVALLTKMWDEWIDELQSQKSCKHIVLKSGEYLSDVI